MHSVQSARGAGADAFTREVIRNKLLAIAGEMGIVLARTSMSPIVYEVLDFACGITDAEARVIAQDNGLCLFTGTFRPQVESILARHPIATMRPGDVFMTNGPYGGGTHTADVALVMPIFAGDEVIAFGISVTHWTEIGGKVLGSLSPDSTEIFQEGLQFPQLRLYRGGRAERGVGRADPGERPPADHVDRRSQRRRRRGAHRGGPARRHRRPLRAGGDAGDLRRHPRPRRSDRPRSAAAHPARCLRGGRHHRRRRHQRGSDPGPGARHHHPGEAHRRLHRHARPRPAARSTARAAR